MQNPHRQQARVGPHPLSTLASSPSNKSQTHPSHASASEMSTTTPSKISLLFSPSSTSAAMGSATRRLLNHPPQVAEENDVHLLHWHYTEFDDKNFQVHGHTLFYLFILFSLILLITLLLLYARWYFRFRYHHSGRQYNSHAPHPLPCRGLDPAAIKAMPIILHQESAVEREDEMECCICLGVFEDGDKVKVLSKCQHRFHSDCVDRWLLTQSSCPLCRVSLRVDPPTPTSDSPLDIV